MTSLLVSDDHPIVRLAAGGHTSRRRGFLRAWKISGIISHPGVLVMLDPRYGFG
jgi:hypothetical protein